MRKTLRAAFVQTIPVMMGYLFVGLAFGILTVQNGLSPWWGIVMSLVVYAGSMQFVLLSLMTGGASLIEVALMTLMVNFRHVFYGLSFLKPYENSGWRKPYLIFALTDETYSLLCGENRAPTGVNGADYAFCVSALNQFYWVAGTVLGVLGGALISFDTTGIDFAMTALFVTTCVEQWTASKEHRPALVGFGAAVLSLAVFGADNLVIPAMLLITAALLVLRRPIEKDGKKRGAQEKPGAFAEEQEGGR